MPEHPLYRSVEATESALRLLPSMALSSAQSGLILLGQGHLHNLDEQGWKNLAANLRNLSLLCDQLLSLFGRDLKAEVTRLVMDTRRDVYCIRL